MNIKVLVNTNLDKTQWIRAIFKKEIKFIKYYFKMLIFIYLYILIIINKYMFILNINKYIDYI